MMVPKQLFAYGITKLEIYNEIFSRIESRFIVTQMTKTLVTKYYLYYNGNQATIYYQMVIFFSFPVIFQRV